MNDEDIACVHFFIWCDIDLTFKKGKKILTLFFFSFFSLILNPHNEIFKCMVSNSYDIDFQVHMYL